MVGAMILLFPTGFYNQVLPQKPEDAGNVTFTVSNNPPPRTSLLFIKVPVGLSRKKRGKRLFTDAERRAVVSQLAFSMARSINSTVPSGMKQYETGQILEFVDVVPASIDPMLVADATKIRHDVNMFDLSAMGLTAIEQDAINSEAESVYRSLLDDLNLLVQQRADYEIQISSNQKLLNEIDKTLSGLESLIAARPTNKALVDARTDLINNKVNILAAQTTLIAQANGAANDAETARDKITQLSQLVR